MSRRAAQRRHERETAKLECSVCSPEGPEDHRYPVIWADADAPDPEYRAICAPHLGYALTTLFWGETIPPAAELPPPPRRERELPILVARARRDLHRVRRSDRRHLSEDTCVAVLTSGAAEVDDLTPEVAEALRHVALGDDGGRQHLRTQPHDLVHAAKVAVAEAKRRSANTDTDPPTISDRGGAP